MQFDVPEGMLEQTAALGEALSLPDVTFGIGFKTVNGETTDTLALVAFVSEKLPEHELPEAAVIPPEFGGFPTDVVELAPTLCGGSDFNEYNPLRGGIRITTPGTPIDGGVAVKIAFGTLGAIVRSRKDDSELYLTAGHVVVDEGGGIGKTMFQPDPQKACGTVEDFEWDDSLADGTNPFTAKKKPGMDCGVIRPNERKHKATIEEIGPIGRAQQVAIGDAVKKRGSRTGLTHGTVKYIKQATFGAPNPVMEIIIASTEPNNAVFVDHGDSGSVVVNESNEAVALLYSADKTTSWGIATVLHFVEDTLQVDIVTNGGKGSASKPKKPKKAKTTKAYFFKGKGYARWDIETDMVDVGPVEITEFWKGFPFPDGIDAAVDWGDGKLYFFKGNAYSRWDVETDMVDVGPAAITDFWNNFPFPDGIDAAVNWGDGKVYFFKDKAYARWDIATDMVDVGPAAITDFWNNFPFPDGIDAAVNWGDGKVYFFKGDGYARWDIATDMVDVGPAKITDFWNNFPFPDGIDAALE